MISVFSSVFCFLCYVLCASEKAQNKGLQGRGVQLAAKHTYSPGCGPNQICEDSQSFFLRPLSILIRASININESINAKGESINVVDGSGSSGSCSSSGASQRLAQKSLN